MMEWMQLMKRLLKNNCKGSNKQKKAHFVDNDNEEEEEHLAVGFSDIHGVDDGHS